MLGCGKGAGRGSPWWPESLDASYLCLFKLERGRGREPPAPPALSAHLHPKLGVGPRSSRVCPFSQLQVWTLPPYPHPREARWIPYPCPVHPQPLPQPEVVNLVAITPPLPGPVVPLHIINVLFLNLTEFPLLPATLVLGAQLEPPAPRFPPRPGKSAVGKYHSGIYCVLRKTTKR